MQRPPDQAERPTADLATRAEIALDPRLADIWQLVWGFEDEQGGSAVSQGTLACLLRLAYLQGYADAAAETTPGDLYRELGVKVRAARERTGARRRTARPPRHNWDT